MSPGQHVSYSFLLSSLPRLLASPLHCPARSLQLVSQQRQLQSSALPFPARPSRLTSSIERSPPSTALNHSPSINRLCPNTQLDGARALIAAIPSTLITLMDFAICVGAFTVDAAVFVSATVLTMTRMSSVTATKEPVHKARPRLLSTRPVTCQRHLPPCPRRSDAAST